MYRNVIFSNVLTNIFKTSQTEDIAGVSRNINDMISETEARVLYEMINKINPVVTLEVGLAHGVSALVFCQAHQDSGNINTTHYAVDPNQFTVYNGAALVAIKRAGYENCLRILAGPSHLEIPELIKQGIKVDCAFVDGWHTFDYTLVDFFLIDKILKPGGFVAFHDGYGRAKQKVINFILSHRKYEIDIELMNFKDEPFIKVIKFFTWRIYKDPMLLFSWFHWRYQLKRTSGLIILKKVKEFEPNYDFFKNF